MLRKMNCEEEEVATFKSWSVEPVKLSTCEQRLVDGEPMVE